MEMKSLMTQSSKKNRLIDPLLEEHSKKQVERILGLIQNDQSLLSDLWECYFGEDLLLAQRSSWVIQHYYRSVPSQILPYLDRILDVIHNPLHDAQVRCALSILQCVEIPEEHIGRVYDVCMTLFANPSAPAAFRVFGMQIGANIAVVYPELADEVIQTYLLQEAPSAGLRSRWKKIEPRLKLLKEKNKRTT